MKYATFKYETKMEWLEHRGIGGSDASCLVNKGKWKSLNDLYTNLVDRQIKIKEVINDRMAEGTKAEDYIRKLFMIEHKDFVVEEPPVKGYWLFKRIDYPDLTLTPDGLINDRKGFLEIKDIEIRNKNDGNAWVGGVIPDQYLYQLLWYFVIIDTLEFGVLHARLKFMSYNNNKYEMDHVEEREFLIKRKTYGKEAKQLEKKAIDFIEKNVKLRRRPNAVIKFKKGE